MNQATNDSHGIIEDILALITCAFIMALGLLFLLKAQIVSGGLNGWAVLADLITPYSFSVIFFILNIPFYILSYKNMGIVFTLKTFLAICLVAIFVELLPLVIHIDSINKIFATIAGGTLCGIGLLIVLRHNASLGGFTILAQCIQEKSERVSAGQVLMILDLLLVIVSFNYLSLEQIALCLLSMVVINLVLIVNHKKGRYQI